MQEPSSTSPEFFEALYREKGDPWNFAHAPYEQDRYRRIIAALAHRRYAVALEPGCSIGALTEKLLPLCDKITAFDFSPTAVAQAERRCDSPQVTFRCDKLDEFTDVGGFDLIVLSEIGYYFQPDLWHRVVQRLTEHMLPGTTVLAAHWLGQSSDHVQSGDAVHAALRAEPRLCLEHEERHPLFRIDRFLRS